MSKGSARSVFDYFSKELAGTKSDSRTCENLLDQEDAEGVSNVLEYIEDADLRWYQLPNTKEFQIALRDERAKLNCVTNPHVFGQLLQLDVGNLLAREKSHAHDRLQAAGEFIQKPFRIQLGRGSYGECLAIRADGHRELSHEIGLELSQRSAAAGLRPIGAVVFMQRGVLKVFLRTTDSTVNTSEIAKSNSAHTAGNRHPAQLGMDFLSGEDVKMRWSFSAPLWEEGKQNLRLTWHVDMSLEENNRSIRMTAEQFGGIMLKVEAVREKMPLNERFAGTSEVIPTHLMFYPIFLQ
ncbi:unnamed protein product [Miscanthus lutarioriparius]|uniref:Uncharacterized protein n=1 Tax=Miscanthus lutarioriparius TaxID=422564 RepID=A0A811QBN9_9POAL|nr:unnamed protein product [Miscanthus lutarioriparius]